jgi:hypothetical protein
MYNYSNLQLSSRDWNLDVFTGSGTDSGYLKIKKLGSGSDSGS